MTNVREAVKNPKGWLNQRVMGDSGPQMRVVIWLAVALVTIMAGTFSPAAGLAFIALGLLLIVVLEFAVWQQDNERG